MCKPWTTKVSLSLLEEFYSMPQCNWYVFCVTKNDYFWMFNKLMISCNYILKFGWNCVWALLCDDSTPIFKKIAWIDVGFSICIFLSWTDSTQGVSSLGPRRQLRNSRNLLGDGSIIGAKTSNRKTLRSVS